MTLTLHTRGSEPGLCVTHRLQALFVALNDEAGSVRAFAINVVGRLASLNPGYILPAARKHLIQLLNDMEHSPDSRQRQGTLRAVLQSSSLCLQWILSVHVMLD